MTTHHASSASFWGAIRRTLLPAACLFQLGLSLGLPVEAQEQTRSLNPKELMLSRIGNRPLGTRLAIAAIRGSVSAQWATPQKPKELVLHHFESPLHGTYPATGVIRDSEGNLYGTTNGSYSDIGGGGKYDAGVVFKIDPWGHETVLFEFMGADDGSTPNGLIRDAAGNLYGTASYGGAAGAGVIFEVDTSGKETVLYSFTGGNDGAFPNSLVRDAKGNLYGTTSLGGASSNGVVFKIAGGQLSVLYTFSGGADGASPTANVALDSQGNLYGTTNFGGGTASAGVVFKVTPSGHETVLYTFTGGNDGAQPNGVLRDVKGDLYGTTSDGGADGAGVVFKVDPSGRETVLYTFTGGNDGGYSDAGLTLDAAGDFFGTTNGGGTADLGVVFKLDASGHETVLHTFTRGAEGNQPDGSGVILDPAGNLYGTASFGGSGGTGSVFKVDKSGDTTVVYAFPSEAGGQYPYNAGVTLGPGGRLFGTTFYGGSKGAGVVYRLDGAYEEPQQLYTFGLSTSNGFGQPTGGLTRDPAGNLYGTTFIGRTDSGYGFGAVYKIDATGRVSALHNFTGGADGAYPYAQVIHDLKGNVLGTASGGGASGNGVVFEVDPSGQETVLYSFGGGDDGGYPLAGLIRDADGTFYGTTTGGGASNEGVVFKLDKSGRETVLYSFMGEADGGTPLWGVLARDSAGNLYGTTVAGGTTDEGVVYEVDAAGHESVLYSFTGGDDGGNPEAGLTLGCEGQLYGTTAFGGKSDIGVVFEIKP